MDERNALKLCKDCKHFVPQKGGPASYHFPFGRDMCAAEIDSVRGRPVRLCIDQRTRWWGCGSRGRWWTPKETPASEALRDPYGGALLAAGLKGFPECEECQCYPEGRIDCPDHVECNKRLGLRP